MDLPATIRTCWTSGTIYPLVWGPVHKMVRLWGGGTSSAGQLCAQVPMAHISSDNSFWSFCHHVDETAHLHAPTPKLSTAAQQLDRLQLRSPRTAPARDPSQSLLYVVTARRCPAAP